MAPVMYSIASDKVVLPASTWARMPMVRFVDLSWFFMIYIIIKKTKKVDPLFIYNPGKAEMQGLILGIFPKSNLVDLICNGLLVQMVYFLFVIGL